MPWTPTDEEESFVADLLVFTSFPHEETPEKKQAQEQGFIARLKRLAEEKRLDVLARVLKEAYGYGPFLARHCLETEQAHRIFALMLLLCGDRSFVKDVIRYLLPLFGPLYVVEFLRGTLDEFPEETGFAIYHVPYQFYYWAAGEGPEGEPPPLRQPEVRAAFKGLVVAAEERGALEFEPDKVWGGHPRDWT